MQSKCTNGKEKRLKKCKGRRDNGKYPAYGAVYNKATGPRANGPKLVVMNHTKKASRDSEDKILKRT